MLSGSVSRWACPGLRRRTVSQSPKVPKCAFIACEFAGVAGALFRILNRGVFADFLFWPKTAEVLIMTILGGMKHRWGPVVGTAMLVLLNQQIMSCTEYRPLAWRGWARSARGVDAED